MSLNNKIEALNTLKVESPVFFNVCDDVNLIRFFYSELVGLKEKAYKKNSFVEYKYQGKTMMFYQAENIFKRLNRFNVKYNNEKIEPICWSIKVDEEKFAFIVQKLSGSNIEIFNDEPVWQPDGYWNFPVLDPMGNKVEIYMEPKKNPASGFWTDNLSPNKKIVRFIYQAIIKKLAI